MKTLALRILLLIIVTVLVASPSVGQTEIPGGNVSGSWTVLNSPYRINGEITIPDGTTLTIEPGVEVVFMGHYKFNVQGRLLAVGSQQDLIHFTANDPQTGWHGIRFNNTPGANDTSRIIYCELTNGKANTGLSYGLDRCGGAILIDAFNKVVVAHCLFHSNMNSGDISTAVGGAAIFVQSASPIIRDNTFSNNTGTTDCSIMSNSGNVVISHNVFTHSSGPHGPIVCAYSSPIISDNIVSDNVTTRAGGGIFTISTTAIITNNIIINNRCSGGEGEGGGIKCWINDRPIIINNTIAYNSATHGGGICCNQNADPLLINNILWGNVSNDGNQVNCLEGASDPDFYFCDIQGGKGEFRGSGAGDYYTGTYENNVDCDPMFNDAPSGNFSLSDNSPCLSAAIDSLKVAGVWYRVPPTCCMGNPRPSPADSKPDIGACENLLATSVVGKVRTHPEEFALCQNCPNPFNPATIIQYTIVNSQFTILRVYDILGCEVATLVNEKKAPGSYTVPFNASGLASGVYLYRLQAGSFVQTKRMLVLK